MAETASGQRRRRLALWVYLVGSAGIGLGIGLWLTMDRFAIMNVPSLRPLVYLLYPLPTFLVAGLSRARGDERSVHCTIVGVYNLLYFLALFYPFYRLVVLDRATEASRRRVMTAILILFVTGHLLMGWLLSVMFHT
jgi:hypothetical protein